MLIWQGTRSRRENFNCTLYPPIPPPPLSVRFAEGLEEADLEQFRRRYEELARTAREALRRGELDTGTPEIKPD